LCNPDCISTMKKSINDGILNFGCKNHGANDRGELLYIVSALQCAPGLVELIIHVNMIT
jgi:hypothetical protein